MNYTQNQREYQQLHRVLQRIEPNRVEGDFLSKEGSRKYADQISEEASEQCSPNHRRNAAVEKQLHHLLHRSLKVKLFEYNPAAYGK